MIIEHFSGALAVDGTTMIFSIPIGSHWLVALVFGSSLSTVGDLPTASTATDASWKHTVLILFFKAVVI
jgi:hypothetical protein